MSPCQIRLAKDFCSSVQFKCDVTMYHKMAATYYTGYYLERFSWWCVLYYRQYYEIKCIQNMLDPKLTTRASGDREK